MKRKLSKLREELISEMVFVPEDHYEVGARELHQKMVSHDGLLLRRLLMNPRRTVHVPNFRIGSFLVTNRQFEVLFPRHTRSNYGALDDHPVVDVTYVEAFEFARRLELRLPTEIEWEVAATENESENLDRASYNCWPSLGLNLRGAYSPSVRGIYDLRGNAYDMTSPPLSEHEARQVMAVRGGSWGTCRFGCVVPMKAFADPLLRSNRIGFRLAVSTL